jgi:hypothetical protein
MKIQLITALWALAGLVVGGLIGVSFGMLQQAAWRRHQKLEHAHQLNSAWGVMPGSMRRVAGLLAALALIQVLCPLIFAQGSQWWVSGGVVAGYGAILFSQLRRRLAQRKVSL